MNKISRLDNEEQFIKTEDFFLVLNKTYVMGTHKNQQDEAIPMRNNNIGFYET